MGATFPIEISGNFERERRKQEVFATSFCSMWAAGGLSAPHKNRQCPPKELLFFSLSEFRNATKNGLPGSLPSRPKNHDYSFLDCGILGYL